MFRNGQTQLQQVARHLVGVSRNLASLKSTKSKDQTTHEVPFTPKEELRSENINASFLSRTFGCHYRNWFAALEKHPELNSLKKEDVINSIDVLKSFNFQVDEILSKPMIIYYNYLTLLNRHMVLKECGFESISVSMLAKYVTVMNKSIALLKSHKYIPYNTNVTEKLKECFTDLQIELPHEDSNNFESIKLKELREIILNQYLRARIDMSDSDLKKMWKSYSRVRHKSFKTVQDVMHILLVDLNFPKERIRKNIYLAHADADNIRRIIAEIPTIDGEDIREIIYKRPKIIMSSIDSLLKTLQHVREFGIKESAILRCMEVLTLGPDTVLERLREMNQIEEFQVLRTNPRIMRLVHYQNKARMRLDYLNQLKVRCASLHILSCGSEAFANFARFGSDRTKGRDVVVYLSEFLEKDENELRSMLSRHPNWCHIPVLHIKQCLEFLLSKKFSKENIFNNVHLLLYPMKIIEEKLSMLLMPEFFKDLQINVRDIHDLTNNEILTLILYLIELDFHFTGDGIWTEQHSHTVENFNNLLPDFPESANKVYKYGLKSPSERLAMN